jgi:hypothetical protein
VVGSLILRFVGKWHKDAAAILDLKPPMGAYEILQLPQRDQPLEWVASVGTDYYIRCDITFHNHITRLKTI